MRIKDIKNKKIKEKALQYAKENFKGIKTETEERLLDKELNVAFTWYNTKEGHDFWEKLNG